jgi:uncharacterized protein (TIGR02118 family)
MQFKMIYLAKRNPGVSEEDWPRTWRSHAKFSSQFPSIGAAISSLIYSSRIFHPTLDGAAFDAPDADREHDGVAVVAANSADALQGQLSPADRERIFEDERRVFATLTPNFTFHCQEVMAWGGAPGQAAVIRFLKRRPELSSEAFADRWNRDHAHIATRVAGVSRTVVRHVHNSPIAPPPPAYPIDGISETWFASAEDAARSLADEAFAQVRQDLAEFCDMDRSITMLTEVIYRWPRV